MVEEDSIKYNEENVKSLFAFIYTVKHALCKHLYHLQNTSFEVGKCIMQVNLAKLNLKGIMAA